MTDHSYISTYSDFEDPDTILVWERPIAGGPRTLKRMLADRYFYVPDPNGKHTGIDGVKLKRLSFDTDKEFKDACAQHKRRYESDIRPEARVLMDNYFGVPTPIIHYAFIDIEVDYSTKLGWSTIENPYAPVNAVTIYKSWTREYITLAVPPPGWVDDGTFQAKIQASWKEYKLDFEPRVHLCKDERELLTRMLAEIDDADVLSGWNSEFFDIPYIVERLLKVFGKSIAIDVEKRDMRPAAGLCFKGARPPMLRKVNKFGREVRTYTLYGRTHLDYLDLFKKFTFEGRVSYALANIAAEELDIPKLDYEGTLEELYKNDFVHFVTYNARDVEVLVKLDLKYKLMQLVNQMAHENTVPFVAILGTVRYVETGIMNRAKNVHKLICTDKRGGEHNKKVEGAIVMTPLAGLFAWLGSVDITSLYPSVIRALNMSVETFIGQFEDPDPEDENDPVVQLYGEHAWNGINALDDKIWHARTVLGPLAMTGAEWHAFIRECGYALSAFGTLFDQSKPGMVADTLTFWFNERKRLQAEKKKYAKLAKEEKDPAKKKELEAEADHYDLLQLTKKIQLNSCYGALLNEAFRFGRREIGASVTGTGRQISIHMGQTIGSLITGKPCLIEKAYAFDALSKRKGKVVDGAKIAKWREQGDWEAFKTLSTKPMLLDQTVRDEDAEDDEDDQDTSGAVYWTQTNEVIYGDTDSCYFMTRATNYEDAVARADEIAKKTNATFPEFMATRFNCTDGREKLIAAAREIVAERGLFLHAKKKYTLKVVNLDGADLREKPKLKSMGSEIKKADTPKVVQDFLKGLMDLVLSGKEITEIEKFVNSNRTGLIHKNEDLMSLGVAKQINNLDAFHAAWVRNGRKGGKVVMLKDGVPVPTNVPGHVRAAINYNELLEHYNDKASRPLTSGDKGVIFYLKANREGFKSIAFPADMMHLPHWFVEDFEVDLNMTEEKMIDAKLTKIFEALGKPLPTLQRALLNSVFTF